MISFNLKTKQCKRKNGEKYSHAKHPSQFKTIFWGYKLR